MHWDQRVNLHLWKHRFVVFPVTGPPLVRPPRPAVAFWIVPDEGDDSFAPLARAVIEALPASSASPAVAKEVDPPFLAAVGAKMKMVGFQRASEGFSVSKYDSELVLHALKEFPGERGWRRDPEREVRLSPKPTEAELAAALRQVIRALPT